MFGRAPKLVLWFTIITLGPYFDVAKVARFYNVRRLIGRPARNGGFKVGFHGEFIREYGRLFRVPSRVDRISMTPFQRHILIGTVRTVERGSNQREIPEACSCTYLKTLYEGTQMLHSKGFSVGSQF